MVCFWLRHGMIVFNGVGVVFLILHRPSWWIAAEGKENMTAKYICTFHLDTVEINK